MSISKLKAAVTRYFGARRRELRALNGRRIRRKDDFFELYVLARLARAIGGTSAQQLGPVIDGRRVFTVATSPTPRWVDISYLLATIGTNSYAMRTGLAVRARTGRGRAELDVAVIDMAALPAAGDVPAVAVAAGLECKAHRHRLQQPHAHEMLGKAFRVFGLPVNPRRASAAGGAHAEPYCLVSLVGIGDGAQGVLGDQGIRHVLANDGAGDELVPHVQRLKGTL